MKRSPLPIIYPLLRSLFPYLPLFVCLHSACQSGQKQRSSAASCSFVEPSAPTITHAQGVAIENLKDSTHRIWIKDAATQDTLACFRLVPRDKKQVVLQEGERVLRIPIQRWACMSLTFVGGLELLGLHERVVGVSDTALIYDAALRRRASEGKVHSIALNQVLDRERLLALAPDVLMLDYMDYRRLRLETLEEVPCFFNMDWKETSPLGRAEWIKVLGLLAGKGATATELFAQKEHVYKQWTERARALASRPTVLFGQEYNGLWYLPDAYSYVAALLADAGGVYHAPEGVEGGALSTEQVFAQHGADDVWLAWASAPIRSLQEFAQGRPHYRLFKAYRTQRVYLNDLRSTPSGGNDYWEQAPYFPELLLQDMVTLLHKPQEKGASLHYWRRLE